MGVRKPDIELHVERLVLHDVAPGDRHRVGEALSEELTRLLTAESFSLALAGGADVEYVDAGALRPTPTSAPSAVGTEVARTVYRGLTAAHRNGPPGKSFLLPPVHDG